MSQLGNQLPLSKSKVSELMSGRMYPRWEILYPLATALGMPYAPLFRLWRQAALETQNRSHTWVKGSSLGVTVTTPAPAPPLDHLAFRNLTEDGYHRYSEVFLPDERGDLAVIDTFDQLWLSWPRALSSPDARRFAWKILRATIMSRTPHLDGRPEFSEAAFDTVTMRTLTDEAERMEHFAETQALFKAMSRLPDNQLDVMVLRWLCGMPTQTVCDLLVSRWPPSARTNATPPASLTLPCARRQTTKGTPRDPHRTHPRPRAPAQGPHRAPRHRPAQLPVGS
ncbi:sigma-70 family RNA polymerase sigma factor [Streptomyces sp. NPDC006638]|uniref:sigma-70 family RNA polymerase sigma factor n=1 Tax=Streptomyces sp. NPDC006638 TaxID=3157183 RepID=UPI0033AC4213